MVSRFTITVFSVASAQMISAPLLSILPSPSATPSSEGTQTQRLLYDRYPVGAVDQHVALLKSIARIPTVKAGILNADGSQCNITFETLDIESNARIQHEKVFIFPAGAPPVAVGAGTPSVLQSGSVNYHSPSRKRSLRTTTVGESDVRLDCWGAEGPICSAAAKKVHRNLVADPTLQQVCWNLAETRVFYVAEANATPKQKFWDDRAAPVANETAQKEQNAFVASDTWGEKLSSHSTLGLFCFDIESQKIVSLVSKEFLAKRSCFNPVWVESTQEVLFLALNHDPLRFGLFAYNTRPATLYSVKVSDSGVSEPTLVQATAAIPSICGMKLHQKSNTFYFLHAVNTEVHGSGCNLSSIQVGSDRAPRLVVETKRSFTRDPDAFPGLFPNTGSEVLQWLDDNTLLVVSGRKSATAIYSVDLRQLTAESGSGPVTPTVLTSSFGTWALLDVRNSVILAVHSAATKPPKVAILNTATAGAKWTTVFDTATAWPEAASILSSLRTDTVPFPYLHNSEALIHYSTLHSATTPQGKKACVVFLHGGPHTADTNLYMTMHLAMLLVGFEIISINYGGSTGFGQESLEALPGHVGEADVGDIVAILSALQRTNKDKYLLFVSGGSHGGFLSAHLTGQHPEMFAGASMRNPVINLNAMADETDIPDWILVEGGVCGRQEAEKLYHMSPIRFVKQVKCPTLIGIGSNDLRVPPSQGRGWYRAIKRSNPQVDVQLLEYPNNGHALDGVHASTDFLLHTLLGWSGVVQKS